VVGRPEVELVQQMCGAFARGDWEAAAGPLAEDVE
jgi:hypothetical protein